MIADPKATYFLPEADLEVFMEGCKIARKAGKEKRFLDMFFCIRTRGADILTAVNNTLTALQLLHIGKS